MTNKNAGATQRVAGAREIPEPRPSGSG
jgi:hypothetical protein